MANTYQFHNGAAAVYSFLEMGPSPPKQKQRHTYLVRTNVDQASIYRDGLRGELFPIRTVVDAQTAILGHVVIAAYANSVGSIYDIIYQNVNYGSYLIHDVQTNGFEVLNLVGGLTGSSAKYMIEAEWTVYPLGYLAF